MPPKELIAMFENVRGQDISLEEVRPEIREQGWTDEEIDAAYNAVFDVGKNESEGADTQDLLHMAQGMESEATETAPASSVPVGAGSILPNEKQPSFGIIAKVISIVAILGFVGGGYFAYAFYMKKVAQDDTTPQSEEQMPEATNVLEQAEPENTPINLTENFQEVEGEANIVNVPETTQEDTSYTPPPTETTRNTQKPVDLTPDYKVDLVIDQIKNPNQNWNKGNLTIKNATYILRDLLKEINLNLSSNGYENNQETADVGLKVLNQHLTGASQQWSKQRFFLSHNSFLPYFITETSNYVELAERLADEYEEVFLNVFTEEEKAILKEKIQLVDGEIHLPDANDPDMDFVGDRSWPSFTIENDEIKFLEEESEIYQFMRANLHLYIVNENRFTFRTPGTLMDVVKIDGEWKIDLLEPRRPFSDEELRLYDKYGSDTDSYVEGFISDTNLETFQEYIAENPHIERMIILHFDMHFVNKSWDDTVLKLLGQI